MFGYVLPLRGELKVRELEAYQSIYCGLCHTLGRRYGFMTRFLLNYDFTFLAMLLAPKGEEPVIRHRRCAACPLKGKDVCQETDALALAADESVILTYWKLRDNAADDTFWKRLAAGLLSVLLRRSYRKAAALRPDFDRQVQGCLAELHQLEGEGTPSLDRTADTFARILRAAAPETDDPERDRTLSQLLYHVGRWIYLVDAWDDLAEDQNAQRYNPVAARYPDGPDLHRGDLRVTMKHSLNLAVSACNLTDFGHWNGIVLNILCLGLPMVEEAVFTGAWRQMKKANRRTKHERSV